MAIASLTWERFAACQNNDGKDINGRFEDLARMLFAHDYLDCTSRKQYLQSTVNLPGIETEPVVTKSGKKVGFQAKYFSPRIEYAQILDCFAKVVKYYKTDLDELVFYCNRTPSNKSQQFNKAKKLLEKEGIELNLVCGDAILDSVRQNADLMQYFFGVFTLTDQWIQKNNKSMFKNLADRYNRDLNVKTDSSDKLSLFALDRAAIDRINKKKKLLLDRIEQCFTISPEYAVFLRQLAEKVRALPDINYASVEDAFAWFGKIESGLKDEIAWLKKRKEEKERELSACSPNEENSFAYYENRKALQLLEIIIKLPKYLEFTDYEKRLVNENVLVVSGRAGVGKSHMFAYEVNTLQNEGRSAILLLANMYMTKEPIGVQIMKNLGLDFSFPDFIKMLDVKGATSGRYALLCIDALNETGDMSLWKKHLSSVIEEINGTEFVKLAVSYRTEFRDCILSDSLFDESSDERICWIEHNGFASSPVTAAKDFFNHYEVPFPVSRVLDEGISNPLVLNLYCKSASKGNFILPAIYDALVKKADEGLWKTQSEMLKTKGFNEGHCLVEIFVDELAEHMNADKFLISKSEVENLNFWNAQGLSPHPFLESIGQEELTMSVHNEDGEYYGFAYDSMRDYFIAKHLMSLCKTKEEASEMISRGLLRKEGTSSEGRWSAYLFENVCVIYSSKFKEECSDILDNSGLPNRSEYVNAFFSTYKWRGKSQVNADVFWRLADKYSIQYEKRFNILIHNSLKPDHPLNADFLNEILSRFSLRDRDYYWTSLINDIESYNPRLLELVLEYEKGNGIFCNLEQKKLLLTLFAWLLTSSNRMLRDKTSKALVEILKKDFALCLFLLRKFEKVNDPYVIQRLYGVVFGACCKRTDACPEQYEELAQYVYSTIFDKDDVYPDVLLRDYARLIIENFLRDNPSNYGSIDKTKIEPRYRSEPIPPVLEDYTDYRFDGSNRGTCSIVMSMKLEEMGWYGDFGHYVFERAFRKFDVDIVNLFNYAISFIVKELGYDDRMFSEIDERMKSLDLSRSHQGRIERIGKKYQWIAFHNILARVSDNCEMKAEKSGEWAEDKYEGPWYPFVRDFDPTLNENFMKCDDAPNLKGLDAYNDSPVDENGSCRALLDNVLQNADDGTQWLVLFCDFKIRQVGDDGVLHEGFVALRSLFVSEECMPLIVFDKNRPESCFPYPVFQMNDFGSFFNREYPWNLSCLEEIEYGWIMALEPWTKELGLDHLSGSSIFQSTNGFCWSAEYDDSMHDYCRWRNPCAKLINSLNLHRKECECAFYDDSNRLVVFYKQACVNGSEYVLIRKDCLDGFLKDSGYHLIGVILSEQYKQDERGFPSLMEKELGLFNYDAGCINGDVVKPNGKQ